jgi:hypothetical protein
MAKRMSTTTDAQRGPPRDIGRKNDAELSTRARPGHALTKARSIAEANSAGGRADRYKGTVIRGPL